MGAVPDSFFDAVLAGVGGREEMNNLILCRAWQQAEGGGAAFNPFNTTEPEPGATDYNSAGVKNYPDGPTGVRATVATLLNGDYPDILVKLRANASPYVTAAAVGASPWGTDGAAIQSILKAWGVPPGGYAPTNAGGFLMALTDAEQAEVLAKVRTMFSAMSYDNVHVPVPQAGPSLAQMVKATYENTTPAAQKAADPT